VRALFEGEEVGGCPAWRAGSRARYAVDERLEEIEVRRRGHGAAT
jgi:hypothetical protein